tara:strand:+ start:199 stop:486 length:288 start_codon:yes stop_codon:yes gene_type:complete
MANGEVKKNGFSTTMTKNSTISIGLVVLIIVVVIFIVRIEAQAQKNSFVISEHITSPIFHENIINKIDSNFIPRLELDQRLRNIEESMVRIEEKL